MANLEPQKEKLSSKIPAGVSELRQAFNSHLSAYEKTTDSFCASSYLLLFYAAECGMKSIWLKRNKLRTTNDISDSTLLSPDGHNLDRWKKELKISARIVGETPHFSLANGGSDLGIEKAHQVWRYGIRMNSEKEKRVVEWLKNVCNWVKEEINR
ncbi:MULTISPECIES: hypothetical protein [unclassified Microcoleus]|uniref:hypothetical protein n=1 Tax=unclassified Microcoleus TaxID=2642155 RepID=UPI002FD430AA